MPQARLPEVLAWIKEHGWSFPEMTDAQRLEMRRHFRICGAETSRSHYTEPCTFTPYPTTGRCRIHGGASPIGMASPHYRGKGRGRHMPDRWLKRFAEARVDPNLLSCLDDLAELEAQRVDIYAKLGTGDSASAWQALRQTWRDLAQAIRGKETPDSKKRILEGMTAIDALINRGTADSEARQELAGNTLLRAKLIETESRRRKETAEMVLIADAMGDYQGLALANRTVIENVDLKKITAQELLNAIATEWARITGFDFAADVSTGNGRPRRRSLPGDGPRKALPG